MFVPFILNFVTKLGRLLFSFSFIFLKDSTAETLKSTDFNNTDDAILRSIVGDTFIPTHF